jgi:hypothetical protein
MDKDFVIGQVKLTCFYNDFRRRTHLDDDDYYGVLDFCRALCATIAIMEKDDDLRKRAIKEADKIRK